MAALRRRPTFLAPLAALSCDDRRARAGSYIAHRWSRFGMWLNVNTVYLDSIGLRQHRDGQMLAMKPGSTMSEVELAQLAFDPARVRLTSAADNAAARDCSQQRRVSGHEALRGKGPRPAAPRREPEDRVAPPALYAARHEATHAWTGTSKSTMLTSVRSATADRAGRR